jgi:mycofactocin precursor
MFTETTPAAPATDSPAPATAETRPATALKDSEAKGGQPRILEEVVVEEVSIDGMCGVY